MGVAPVPRAHHPLVAAGVSRLSQGASARPWTPTPITTGVEPARLAEALPDPADPARELPEQCRFVGLGESASKPILS